MHKKEQIRPGLRNEPAKEEKLTSLLSGISLLKSANNVSIGKLFIRFSIFTFVRADFDIYLSSPGAGGLHCICENLVHSTISFDEA
ncbi:hypothetical protein NNG64_08345 [Bacillus siamensis]|uniref:Uncharacterized protein n=1 Tax=Bacillus siamensis TaxID=659243 RepID=A0AAI8MYN9_9BACI|nr:MULTISPECIES: hypothetical protein [Bacillus]AME05126.1 hypothetical protein AUL54_01690 [Bacillus sp. SDLI1]AUJ77500.1 hypothetical protein CWD84_12110 [Bacillus siamensis]UUA85792.1 hypothetical protein NNG64_08345 [Bacillus siamensis]